MKPSSEFFEICRHIGQRTPLWTQGAGGNVSQKIGNYLWIKASGLRLDQVSEGQGYACVRLNDILERLAHMEAKGAVAEVAYAQALKDCAEQGAGLGRPSMETGFHALLEFEFVCHFHSLCSLLMAHEYSLDAKRVMAWFKNQPAPFASPVFLAVEVPGLELSKAMASFATVPVQILKNHGVVLQLSSASQLNEWEQVERQFCRDFSYATLAALYDSASSVPDGPFKIYMPDTAVFIDRIKKILSPVAPAATSSSAVFRLNSEAALSDKDAAELWNATQILYQACPALAEVPESVSSILAGLPTEVLRKNISR